MGDKVFKLKNLNVLWNIIVSALNSKSNSGHIHNNISAIDITGQTVDVNTYNLSSGSPFTQLYIEKTSGGASNITNIPVTGQPFRLFVDLVRWASTSDYITRQTFVSIGTKSTYERWCTNGTWTSWLPVSRFTATPASGQVLVSDGTAGGVKTSGFTIGKSVPADAKFTDTTYTHPTTAGNKHIPSGGSSGQILRWSADGTAVWGADNNTTYSPATLGQGYGTCTTAAATVAKVVTLSGYVLVTGGIVAVKFTYDVPANATMNINSKGAKSIYYRGAAIIADVIKAGDIGLFIYNGSQYHLLAIDRDDNLSDSELTSIFTSIFTKTQ